VSPGEAEEASIADTAPEPPALETPPGEPVQVQRSETLRKIALRKYGQWNPRVFEQIRKENPWLTDPDKVRAGQTLILPSWESFGETTAP
jgi:nucleoid-associated protein YgaU